MSDPRPGASAGAHGSPAQTAKHRAPSTDVDGVLLVSFGGPRVPEDVVPFLENVTAGRGIPRERLEVVGEHYFARGGASPINDETDALADAIREALATQGRPEVGVYVGNRNWDPYIDDAVQRAVADGVTHLAVVVTSAYSGYSSCRQYREDVAAVINRAREANRALPRFSYVRPWGLQPSVLDTWGRRTTAVASAALTDVERPEQVRIVFVAHSLPTSAARTSGPVDAPGAYERELNAVAGYAAARAARETGTELDWELTWCSRSGRPEQPWLVPDISDALVGLAGQGVTSVAVVPIGFVADHMEVVQDLDTDAAATADRLGIAFHRAETLRAEPEVAATLAELALAAGAAPGLCPPGCCRAPARPASMDGPGPAPRPAAFEVPATGERGAHRENAGGRGENCP